GGVDSLDGVATLQPSNAARLPPRHYLKALLNEQGFLLSAVQQIHPFLFYQTASRDHLVTQPQF
ncbi:hypothetical protein, partial [Oceanisphaera arctica]|uniref:hypothetical protein n=1 Tax=Oceanisphaera arctica TaxID=641510 RepID=UPI001E3436C2